MHCELGINVYVIASLLAVLSTIVIVNKAKSLDAEKDRLLKIAMGDADVKIAQAKADAAIANQKAQEANDEAVNAENENLKLRGQVSSDASTARTAEAALAKANKETSDFAHALQQQQGAMAEQAKVSPVLTDYQIQALANTLSQYAGQDVALHTTAETVVRRLAAGIKMALSKAGITTKLYSADMSALYQGVSVAVHAPDDVPPIANALILGLRQAGINAHPVSVPSLVPAGQVGIFLGPS